MRILPVANASLPEPPVHGPRRVFGTRAEQMEMPAGISMQIMGHKPRTVAEERQRAHRLDLLRKWLSKIEAWILAEAGIPQPKEGAGRLRVVD